MFKLSFFRRSSRGKTVTRRRPLAVEMLEARNCPTTPGGGSLTLNALVEPAHDVALSGTVSGTNAPGATVTFSGAATGSTTADASGNCTFSTNSATLGTVSAVASYAGTTFTAPASATIAVTAPSVSASITATTADTVTVSGALTDVDAAGQTLAVTGATDPVVTDAEGNYSVTLASAGLSTVDVSETDLWGEASNTAEVDVAAAPVLQNFVATLEGGNIWLFRGRAVGTNVAGLTVSLGGIPALDDKSTTVNADGSFAFTTTLTVQDIGFATAQIIGPPNSNIVYAGINSIASTGDSGSPTTCDGDSITLDMAVANPASDVIAYSAAGLPTGLSIDSNTGIISGTVASNADAAGPYSVIVTATDSTQNVSATESFDLPISQPTLTLTPPGDQAASDGDTLTLSLPATDTGNNHSLTWSAVGLPNGLTIDSGTGIISGALDSDADAYGPYAVTVTVTDAAANLSTQTTFNWTVAQPTLSLTSPGDQASFDGDTVTLPLYAYDTGNYHSLTWSAVGLPNGLTIDSGSGIISGTLDSDADAYGPYSVQVTATDPTANLSASTTFNWTMAQPTLSLTSPGDQASFDGDTVTLPLSAYDTGNNHSLTWSAVGLPNGLTIDSGSGIISGALDSDADAYGPYAVQVTATDPTANLSASTTFNWTMAQPTLSLTSPGDQASFDGDTVTLPLSATDTGNSHSLTWSAVGLPNGLTIDSGTGIISGALDSDADAYGPYAVTVTVTDAAANLSASTTFNWTMAQPTLSLTSPGDQASFDGDTVTLPLSATDTGNSHSLTWSAVGLPNGLTIDSGSGIIYGNLDSDADAYGPYSVQVTATDPTANLSASTTFNWTAAQPTLSLTPPGDQAGFDGDTVTLPLSATDTGNNHSLTWSAVGLPNGLTIDSGSGIISGTLDSDADAYGPYAVQVTATDPTANLSASTTFNWTAAQPTLSLTSPGDQASFDGDTVMLPLSATDTGNSHSLTWSAVGLPYGLTIDSGSGTISGTIASYADAYGPYAVTVTVTDANANLTTVLTFNWGVTQPAVTLTNPGDQTNNDGDAVTLYLSASNTANHPLTYTVAGAPPGLAIASTSDGNAVISGTIDPNADVGSPYVVTVTATDASTGLSTTLTFNWTVN